MQDETAKYRISRRQKKQRVQPYLALAEALSDMKDSDFAQLTVPQELRDDIEQARITKGNSSRKRQTKYLAGVLNREQSLSSDLLQSLETLQQAQRDHVHAFHEVENMRDRLCAKESFAEALTELQNRFGKEACAGFSGLAKSVQHSKDKRAFREIYKKLQALMSEKRKA